jgi:serine protease DegQ
MLAGDDGDGESNQPVFAAAYSLLRDPRNHDAMSNGLTTGPSGDGTSSGPRLSFYSGAQPGASGSAVLSTSGLVLGMIVQRETADVSPGDASFVLGVPVSQLKAFLRGNGIGFQASDSAQLGSGQPAGARADTISAGIICG